jgi:hypothetical protein
MGCSGRRLDGLSGWIRSGRRREAGLGGGGVRRGRGRTVLLAGYRPAPISPGWPYAPTPGVCPSLVRACAYR